MNGTLDQEDVDDLIAKGLQSEEMQCLLAELPSDMADCAASAFASKKLDEEVMQSWLSEGSDSSNTYHFDLEQDQQLQSGESDMEEFPAASDDFDDAMYFTKHKKLEMKAEGKKSDIPFATSHAQNQDEKVGKGGEYGRHLQNTLKVDDDKENGKYLQNTLETQDGQVDEDEEFGKYLQNTLETLGDLSRSDLNQLFTSPVKIEKTSSKDSDPENVLGHGTDSGLGKQNLNNCLQERIKNPHNLVKDNSNKLEDHLNVSHGSNIETTTPHTIPIPNLSPESDQFTRDFPQKTIEKLCDSPTSILNELYAFPIKNEEENSDISETNFVLKLNTEAEPTVSSDCLQKTLELPGDFLNIDLGNVQKNLAERQAKNTSDSESKETEKDVCQGDVQLHDTTQEAANLHFPLITDTLDETKKMLKKIEEGIVEVKDQKNLKESEAEIYEHFEKIEEGIVEANDHKNLKEAEAEIYGHFEKREKIEDFEKIEEGVVEVKNQKNLKECEVEILELKDKDLVSNIEFPNEVESKNRKEIFTLRHSDGDSVTPRMSETVFLANSLDSRKEIESPGVKTQGCVDEANVSLRKSDLHKLWAEVSEGFESIPEDSEKVGVEIHNRTILNVEKSTCTSSKAKCPADFTPESEGDLTATEYRPMEPTPSYKEQNVDHETQPDQEDVAHEDKLKTAHCTNVSSTTTNLNQQDQQKNSDVETEASTKEPLESKKKKKPRNKVIQLLRCLRRGNYRNTAP